MARRVAGWMRRLIDELTGEVRLDVGHGDRCKCSGCEATRQDLMAW